MFQEFLEKYQIKDKKIAIAVSGGADSLALLLTAFEELKPLGYQIVALTVDHQLRPNSSKEALYVANIAKKHHIEHHILVWNEKKPLTGIEEAARNARYQLIGDWCKQNKVSCVMVAHHLFDQAETFLMRLERGSGLDGLCGMFEVSQRKNIKILRPLLNTHPDELKNFLTSHQILWIEDETNSDTNMLRNRMRQFLPILQEKTGITPQKIVQTMKCLQNTKLCLDQKVEKLIKNHFKNWNNQAYSCSKQFFLGQDDEIKYRIVSKLIKDISGSSYTPEAEKTLNLIKKTESADFKSATLGHCQILLYQQNLWFLPEKIDMGIYTQKLWKEFIIKNPDLKRCKLPVKIRYILLN